MAHMQARKRQGGVRLRHGAPTPSRGGHVTTYAPPRAAERRQRLVTAREAPRVSFAFDA